MNWFIETIWFTENLNKVRSVLFQLPLYSSLSITLLVHTPIDDATQIRVFRRTSCQGNKLLCHFNRNTYLSLCRTCTWQDRETRAIKLPFKKQIQHLLESHPSAEWRPLLGAEWDSWGNPIWAAPPRRHPGQHHRTDRTLSTSADPLHRRFPHGPRSPL